MSQTVKNLVAGSGLVFEDAGEHDLKGAPDRGHLYRAAPEEPDQVRVGLSRPLQPEGSSAYVTEAMVNGSDDVYVEREWLTAMVRRLEHNPGCTGSIITGASWFLTARRSGLRLHAFS